MRLLIGFTLIFAGSGKLLSLGESVGAISVYVPLPVLQLRVLVITISLLELILALGLYASIGRANPTQFDWVACWLLLSPIGIALFRYTADITSSCGCFGALSFLDHGALQVARDVALAALALTSVLMLGGVKGVRMTAVGVLPLVCVVYLAIAGSSGHLAIREESSRRSPGWLGTTVVDTSSIRKFSLKAFGFGKTNTPLNSRPVWTAESITETGSAGWIVAEDVPAGPGIVRVMIALSTDGRLKAVRFEPRLGAEVMRRISRKNRGRLATAMLRASTGVTPFVEPTPELHRVIKEDALGEQLVDVVNNAINQVWLTIKRHRESE